MVLGREEEGGSNGMNEIKLSKMELRNFKGIKEFTLDIGGQNANIYADNAVGKTTLYDSFLWVLFNKDSANRADFAVKPQDKDGQDIHFLETDVTLELLINGQVKTLRKMLSEKWTKRRGEAEKEFTGHETSYWVDMVPVKKKEFTDQVNAIIDETAFKLLTNPFYFCTQFKWEDRRKALMEICGDVSDEDVIASDKGLAELTEILSGKTIADQKKIIAERHKKLNKDIEAIPIKINELSRTVLSNNINYDVVEAGLAEHKATLEKIEQQMTDASKAAAGYQQKQQDIARLNVAMDERKKELNEGAMVGLKRAMDEKQKLEGEKYGLDSESGTHNTRINDLERLVIHNEGRMANLREAWKKEYETQFIEPDPESFICPTCKQSLPLDEKDARIDQMRLNFEQAKALDLTTINTGGKEIAAQTNDAKVELEGLKTKLTNCELRLADIALRLAELEKELEAERKRTTGTNYEADPKYAELAAQLQAIKKELNKPINDTTTELQQRKREVTEQIDTLNKLLSNRDVAEKTKARIDELKDEERTLAGQLGDCEKQRHLIEQFVKAKVNLLEATINSRFTMVKWKLFDVQINGGISECCEAMVDGVTWPNVNHAGQINAGIDIINTLSGHYGLSCPLWVDNAEAVNQLAEASDQVIRLVVSKDEELKVEVNG